MQKPGNPGNISAVRDVENVAVSFEAPANPDNVIIKGYKVTALADDGIRVRASIMKKALKQLGLHKFESKRIDTEEGDILRIDKNGKIIRSRYEPKIYRSK